MQFFRDYQVVVESGSLFAYLSDRKINKVAIMSFKKLLIGATIAAAFSAAQAGTIQVGGGAASSNGKATNKAGVCTVNFDGSVCANVVETSNSAANVTSGSVPGAHAAPVGDTSNYLVISPDVGSSITFTMMMPANYFGFFAGSLDSFNLVQFFLGNTMVDAFTGTQINAVAFPGQQTNGNQAEAEFIDYFPTGLFDRVVLSSSGIAFELDNLAIGLATPTAVPEPESVALVGLGALALAGARRRKARAA
jgi:hypothetical protein